MEKLHRDVLLLCLGVVAFLCVFSCAKIEGQAEGAVAGGEVADLGVSFRVSAELIYGAKGRIDRRQDVDPWRGGDLGERGGFGGVPVGRQVASAGADDESRSFYDLSSVCVWRESPFIQGSPGLSGHWSGGSQAGAPSRSIINPGVDTQEGTATDYVPQDVWVIQYGGTGDNAPLVGLPRYVELSGMGQANIQAVASALDNTLIFVANTHDPDLDWGNISTLSKMKLSCRVIDGEGDLYGNNYSTIKDLILSGKWVGVVDNGAISAELFRNIARLDFGLQNALGSAMTLKTIQLCGVPKNYYYTSGILDRGVIFPAQGTAFFDYQAEDIQGAANPGGEQRWTFYMPVNQRGTTALSTDSKTKPTYAPSNSTHLRITATNAQGQGYVYRIYPGADMVSNYNISSNNRYAIEMSINSSGDPSTDGRVENYGQVDLPSSNSYILNPAPAGTADRVFTIPIGRLNEFWKDVDPSLVISQGDQWVADLIWQDTPQGDLIRFVDLDTRATSLTMQGTGLTSRIAVTTKASYQGNALIGIKKVGREAGGYIWSWHLWVTDYEPEYRVSPVAKRYVYSVTGGNVHRYEGGMWNGVSTARYGDKYMMDRNLGARSDRYAVQGGLYYQFGRKDPFPCYANGVVLYDIEGAVIPNNDPRNASMSTKNAGQGVTLATGVLNPTFLYYKDVAAGGGDWTSQGRGGSYYWNGLVEGITNKSIFDPCPSGWVVPSNSIWGDFVFNAGSPANSTVLHGGRDVRLTWNYDGMNGLRYWPKNQDVGGVIYYPAMGSRTLGSGMMSNLDVAVYHWASIPISHSHSSYFYADANGPSCLMDANRSNAFVVRCVQE